MDSPYNINPAGFTIHGAVHAVRHDAQCVMHSFKIRSRRIGADRRTSPLFAAGTFSTLVPRLPRL
jgi:hypothetical protein